MARGRITVNGFLIEYQLQEMGRKETAKWGYQGRVLLRPVNYYISDDTVTSCLDRTVAEKMMVIFITLKIGCVPLRRGERGWWNEEIWRDESALNLMNYDGRNWVPVLLTELWYSWIKDTRIVIPRQNGSCRGIDICPSLKGRRDNDDVDETVSQIWKRKVRWWVLGPIQLKSDDEKNCRWTLAQMG